MNGELRVCVVQTDLQDVDLNPYRICAVYVDTTINCLRNVKDRRSLQSGVKAFSQRQAVLG